MATSPDGTIEIKRERERGRRGGEGGVLRCHGRMARFIGIDRAVFRQQGQRRMVGEGGDKGFRGG